MVERHSDQYGCTELLFTHATQDLSKALLGAWPVDVIITLHAQILSKSSSLSSKSLPSNSATTSFTVYLLQAIYYALRTNA